MTLHQHAGISPARLARIDAAVMQHITPTRLPGAVTLLARRGEVLHHKAYGIADRERNTPMQLDTIFRLYSMTKPIVCAALLMLFEEGKLRLIDPASKFLPAFSKIKVLAADGQLEAPKREVTVRDLLTHTAGLSYGWMEYGEAERRYRESNLRETQPLAEFVDTLLALPLAFQPGTRWRYSLAHDVVARLIEVVSGMPIDRFLRERMFDPLGMHDTGYSVPQAKLARFAAMYGSHKITDPGMTVPRMWTDAVNGVHNLLGDPLTSPEASPDNVLRGGQGLVSTAADYLRFCQMMLNNGELDGQRLLGRKTVELMTSNHIPATLLPYEINGVASPGYGFGLGVRVLMDVAASQQLGSVGEHGWAGAACTYYWIDPREQLIGISMAQYMPNGLVPLGLDLRTAAYQAIED